MAQAVSRRPLTAEARVRSRLVHVGFMVDEVAQTGQFHCTGAPLQGKTKKLVIFIFVIGLHNKPQGCVPSVASAAGPFTTKKTFL